MASDMSSEATSEKTSQVDDIQDENVLREMWLETEDLEVKRQIRTRMCKLRDEKLKDLYGREDIIDNILQPQLIGDETDSVFSESSEMDEELKSIIKHQDRSHFQSQHEQQFSSSSSNNNTNAFSSSCYRSDETAGSTNNGATVAYENQAAESSHEQRSSTINQSYSSTGEMITTSSAVYQSSSAQENVNDDMEQGSHVYAVGQGDSYVYDDDGDWDMTGGANVTTHASTVASTTTTERSQVNSEDGGKTTTARSTNASAPSGSSSISNDKVADAPSIFPRKTKSSFVSQIATFASSRGVKRAGSSEKESLYSEREGSQKRNLRSGSETSDRSSPIREATSKTTSTTNTTATSNTTVKANSTSIPVPVTPAGSPAGDTTINSNSTQKSRKSSITAKGTVTTSRNASNITSGSNASTSKATSSTATTAAAATIPNENKSRGSSPSRLPRRSSAPREIERVAKKDERVITATTGSVGTKETRKSAERETIQIEESRTSQLAPPTEEIIKEESQVDQDFDEEMHENVKSDRSKVDQQVITEESESVRAVNAFKSQSFQLDSEEQSPRRDQLQPEKTEEESIIRELDSLDNFLSARSVSVEDGNKDDMERSAPPATPQSETKRTDASLSGTTTVTKKTTTAQASEVTAVTADLDMDNVEDDDEEEGVDVMESGKEKVFEAKRFNYSCPDHDEDDHDTIPHSRRTSWDANAVPRSEDAIVDDIASSIMEFEELERATAAAVEDSKENDTLTEIVEQGKVKSKARNTVSNSSGSTTITGRLAARTNIRAKGGISGQVEEPQVSKSTISETTSRASKDILSKQEKYEADILSRPSVFHHNRTTKSRPEPNPRLRSSSSPERTSGSTITGASAPPSSKKTAISPSPASPHSTADSNNDSEEDDDPLRPPKRPSVKGVDIPGAVLMARELFETKSREAAETKISRGSSDRTSIKVSKKTAMFEARSRGERVSVSSESSLLTEDKDISKNINNAGEDKRTASFNGSLASDYNSNNKEASVKASTATTTATSRTTTKSRRSGSRESSPIHKMDGFKRNNSSMNVKPGSTVIHNRPAIASVESNNSSSSSQHGNTKSTVKTKAALESTSNFSTQKSKAEMVTNTIAFSGTTTHSNTSGRLVSNRPDVPMEDDVDERHKPKASPSSRPTYTPAMVDLKQIDQMEDLQELENLLEKATNYNERSQIRGRIRTLKRKATVEKSSEIQAKRAAAVSSISSATNTASTTTTTTATVNQASIISRMETKARNASEQRKELAGDQVTKSNKSLRKKSSEIDSIRMSPAKSTEVSIKREFRKTSTPMSAPNRASEKVQFSTSEGKENEVVQNDRHSSHIRESSPLKNSTERKLLNNSTKAIISQANDTAVRNKPTPLLGDKLSNITTTTTQRARKVTKISTTTSAREIDEKLRETSPSIKERNALPKSISASPIQSRKNSKTSKVSSIEGVTTMTGDATTCIQSAAKKQESLMSRLSSPKQTSSPSLDNNVPIVNGSHSGKGIHNANRKRPRSPLQRTPSNTSETRSDAISSITTTGTSSVRTRAQRLEAASAYATEAANKVIKIDRTAIDRAEAVHSSTTGKTGAMNTSEVSTRRSSKELTSGRVSSTGISESNTTSTVITAGTVRPGAKLSPNDTTTVDRIDTVKSSKIGTTVEVNKTKPTTTSTATAVTLVRTPSTVPSESNTTSTRTTTGTIRRGTKVTVTNRSSLDRDDDVQPSKSNSDTGTVKSEARLTRTSYELTPERPRSTVPSEASTTIPDTSTTIRRGTKSSVIDRTSVDRTEDVHSSKMVTATGINRSNATITRTGSDVTSVRAPSTAPSESTTSSTGTTVGSIRRGNKSTVSNRTSVDREDDFESSTHSGVIKSEATIRRTPSDVTSTRAPSAVPSESTTSSTVTTVGSIRRGNKSTVSNRTSVEREDDFQSNVHSGVIRSDETITRTGSDVTSVRAPSTVPSESTTSSTVTTVGSIRRGNKSSVSNRTSVDRDDDFQSSKSSIHSGVIKSEAKITRTPSDATSVRAPSTVPSESTSSSTVTTVGSIRRGHQSTVSKRASVDRDEDFQSSTHSGVVKSEATITRTGSDVTSVRAPSTVPSESTTSSTGTTVGTVRRGTKSTATDRTSFDRDEVIQSSETDYAGSVNKSTTRTACEVTSARSPTAGPSNSNAPSTDTVHRTTKLATVSRHSSQDKPRESSPSKSVTSTARTTNEASTSSVSRRTNESSTTKSNRDSVTTASDQTTQDTLKTRTSNTSESIPSSSMSKPRSPPGGTHSREDSNVKVASETVTSKASAGFNKREKKKDEDDDLMPNSSRIVTRANKQRDSSNELKSKVVQNGVTNKVDVVTSEANDDVSEFTSQSSRMESSERLKIKSDLSSSGETSESASERKVSTSRSKTKSTPQAEKSGSTAMSRKATKGTSASATSSSSNEKSSVDAVTSSYGIGPSDDDGVPLFGLRALRKVKQAQEQITQRKNSLAKEEEAEDRKVVVESEGITSSSLRSNDMYGLRALRKSAGANSVMTQGSRSVTGKASGLDSSRQEVEKISSSEEKESVKEGQVHSVKRNGLSGSGNSASVSSTSAPSVTMTTRRKSSLKNDTISTSSWDKKEQQLRDDVRKRNLTRDEKKRSPEPSSLFSREKVGRSSVREMSKRFEGGSDAGGVSRDLSKDSNEAGLAPGHRVTVERSIRRTVQVCNNGVDIDATDDVGVGSDDKMITSLETNSGGGVTVVTRSFLSDRSPVENVSDVLARMRGAEGEDEGRNLLNKFLGAQIIMDGAGQLLSNAKVSMSQSLVIGGVDVDQELDVVKLKQLLEVCKGDAERGRIEKRLKVLVEEETSIRKTTSGEVGGVATRTDVSGELMPLIFGQLQSSLDSTTSSAFGAGGGGGGCDNKNNGSNNKADNNKNGSGDKKLSAGGKENNNLNNNNSKNNNSEGEHGQNSNDEEDNEENDDDNDDDDDDKNVDDEEKNNDGDDEDDDDEEEEDDEVDEEEECLFDSGTESGEDPPATAATAAKSQPPVVQDKTSDAQEFSSFMQGLRNSISKSLLTTSDSCAKIAASVVTQGQILDPSQQQQSELNLIQQVDNALTLLRDSLVADPEGLAKRLGLSSPSELTGNGADSIKGKELIALIDRLKNSLSVDSQTNNNEESNSEKVGGDGDEIEATIRNTSEKKEESQALPTVVGSSSETEKVTEAEMDDESVDEEVFCWQEPQPPDLVPLNIAAPPANFSWAEKFSEGNTRDANGSGPENHQQQTEIPWKMRASQKRNKTRSHTVGVSEEELAEARRYFQEESLKKERQRERALQRGMNEALMMEQQQLREQALVDDSSPSTPSKSSSSTSRETMKVSRSSDGQSELGNGSSLASTPRAFTHSDLSSAGTGSLQEFSQIGHYSNNDDVSSEVVTAGLKLKPFRTLSLDSNYDPSKSFFTPEETVQIAIHQAAIKKQMSEEEDRRKRRNSLSSYKYYTDIPLHEPGKPPSNVPTQLASPPSPSSQALVPVSALIDLKGNTKGGYLPQATITYADQNVSEPDRNNQLVLYDSSQLTPSNVGGSGGKRIENVQISLKELNSSDSQYPQLQIAITLNTNSPAGGQQLPPPQNQAPQLVRRPQVQSQPTIPQLQQQPQLTRQQAVLPQQQSVPPKVQQMPQQQQPHQKAPQKLQPLKQTINSEVIELSSLGGKEAKTSAAESEETGTTGGAPSSDENNPDYSKANRYRNKKERKKRMKRANTIDIPQPPGFALSGDQDSEFDDDETGADEISQSCLNIPFQPKTEGDRKFLAFLEKNNGFEANKPAVRPSYLGVNDRQWNNRFYNIKTSFESSSQGSSPSLSPIPGHRPKTVAELATAHSIPKLNQDTTNKPIWANSSGGIPSTLKNKLHVFETPSKSISDEAQKRPLSQPQYKNTPPHSFPTYGSTGGINTNNNNGNGTAVRNLRNSFIRDPAMDFHPPPMQQQQHHQQRPSQQSHVVRKPVPIKSQPFVQTEPAMSHQGPQQSVPPVKGHEGVHMVHATALAMQAMTRQPTLAPAVPPRNLNAPATNDVVAPPPRPAPPERSAFASSQANPPPRPPPPDKVDLPWAKKELDTSARVMATKTMFEVKPVAAVPNPVPVTGKLRVAENVGSVILKKDSSNMNSNISNNLQKYPPHGISSVKPQPPMTKPKALYPPHIQPVDTKQQQQQPQVYRTNTQNTDKLQQQQYPHNSPVTPPHQGRSILRGFGVAKSFDDHYKSSADYIGGGQVPTTLDQSHNSPFVSVLPSNKSIHQASSTSGPIAVAKISPIKNQSFENENITRSEPASPRKPKTHSAADEAFGDGMILTPVVSKVMGSAQQQRATVTHGAVTSLHDDPSKRKTNARTSLSSLLNQYQSEPTSARMEKPTVPAEALPKINPELPALSKSMSGDSIIKQASNFKPAPSPLAKILCETVNTNAIAIKPSAMIPREPVKPVEQQKPQQTQQQQQQQQQQKQKPTQQQPSQQKKSPLNAPPSSITREDKSRENNPAVPRQRSLSEFPRPRTDFDEVNKRYFQPQPQQPIKANYSAQSTPSMTSVGKSSRDSNNSKHTSSSSPPSNNNNNSNDQIMRTASGTSIFDRTKSLFSSVQDLPIPPGPRSKKPNSSSKNQVMFPKQFEARMSPDSAAEKQRELEAYFGKSGGSVAGSSGNIRHSKKQDRSAQLRKSASHSTIMHSQRSLSDGEDDDVDEIFESLFKASVESKSSLKAEAVAVATSTSSTTAASTKASSSELQSVQSQSSSASSKKLSSESRSMSASSSSSKMVSSSSTSSKSSSVQASSTNKFKQMDQQITAASGNKAGAPLFKFTNEALKTSAASAKDVLLYWCQCRTRDYQNVKIENFSSSWCDGLAFCALIHHFYPDAFDYNSLDPKNRRHNFELAFKVAEEKADIYPLLDVEDMIAMGRRPDWKCVFTYVQSMYRRLKDLA